MRPRILFPLFAPVTSLAGVGPRIGAAIERLAGPHVADLLWHLPGGLIDRRYAPKIAEAEPGRIATLTLEIDRHLPPPNRRLPYKVRCRDETGFLHLVFFHAKGDYLERTLPVGETRVISGTIEDFRGEIQITHPDHICKIEEIHKLQSVEPVYPLTAGITQKVLGRTIRKALANAPEPQEWIEPSVVSSRQWQGWRGALNTAHEPQAESDLDPGHLARQRLAYDELLASQLALLLLRARMRRQKGRTIVGDGVKRQQVIDGLPFSLTASQSTALEEITGDMATPTRMMRLLQGDVGSGKTVVALLAMLVAVEAGTQAVLMAPTEILARQHFKVLRQLAEPAGIRIAILTGRDRGKERAAILDDLASGAIAIAVGTHALFQDDVAFADLGLAVIDEQHRFGVHQRLTLSGKGRTPDVLVMTATPIPRTLLLAAYGDLDASQLTEKPAGRQPIDTRALPLVRIGEVVGAVQRAVENGARAYWVTPLVEESEDSDLAAATERQQALSTVFGDRVGLVHGRMKGPEKDTVMAAFADGSIAVLVATTVIEVGLDVPEATIMVIEHAERFGLAQLHQLRGRIGRGEGKSTCLLLYAQPLGETARARIEILRETDDGFRIAEEDLRLRGGGEVLGTRQSGLPDFRLADLATHHDLLAIARDDAKLVVERDPELTGNRGEALRTLLYLFERDAAVKYLRSG
ncbi:MAG: ATP-dependent DNA helicase RecG [Alphaproteobacteria bacterium]|nr:ATP-dependent DNA helicase RecG [Alphaproteobacteria bacterium]